MTDDKDRPKDRPRGGLASVFDRMRGLVARPRSRNGTRAMTGNGGLKSEAVARFRYELERSRRYERPLSVLLLGLDGAVEGMTPPPAEDDVFSEVTPTLAPLLREIDVVTRTTDPPFLVLVLPECGAAAAVGAGSRLGRHIEALIGRPLMLGVAEFPTDGFVLETLLECAQGSLKRVEHAEPGEVESRA